MKNPNPVNLQASAEIRKAGWQAECRDADGHLCRTHVPFETDEEIVWLVREALEHGETVTIWPLSATATAFRSRSPNVQVAPQPPNVDRLDGEQTGFSASAEQMRATDSFGRDLIERELVSIVLRMSRHLQAVDTPAAKNLDAGALDYLRRKGLMPSPLRAEDTVAQSAPPNNQVGGSELLTTIKEFAHWHHLNEVMIAAGKTPSDSEIDFEATAWSRITRAVATAPESSDNGH